MRFRRAAGVGEGQWVPVGAANVRGAAAGGHLDVLMYAREHDCPWRADVVRRPPIMGTLRC